MMRLALVASLLSGCLTSSISDDVRPFACGASRVTPDGRVFQTLVTTLYEGHDECEAEANLLADRESHEDPATGIYWLADCGCDGDGPGIPTP